MKASEHGQRLARRCHVKVLAAIDEYGTASRYQISAASGYELMTGYFSCSLLISLGLVVRRFKGCYMLTEQGKIAHAIERGRREKRIAAAKLLRLRAAA